MPNITRWDRCVYDYTLCITLCGCLALACSCLFLDAGCYCRCRWSLSHRILFPFKYEIIHPKWLHSSFHTQNTSNTQPCFKCSQPKNQIGMKILFLVCGIVGACWRSTSVTWGLFQSRSRGRARGYYQMPVYEYDYYRVRLYNIWCVCCVCGAVHVAA